MAQSHLLRKINLFYDEHGATFSSYNIVRELGENVDIITLLDLSLFFDRQRREST